MKCMRPPIDVGGSKLFTFHLINYGKTRGNTDNVGVSALAAGYAGGAEGRHDDDQARRLADDQAGGDCHEHPEPGDEGRREGGAVHPEHSDAGQDHEKEIATP